MSKHTNASFVMIWNLEYPKTLRQKPFALLFLKNQQEKLVTNGLDREAEGKYILLNSIGISTS